VNDQLLLLRADD
jgi:hypothetical protein